jgi:flagellar capping protein FliD
MAGMSVSTGLVSGIDYDTMISQLMQVEANPQALLKKQLSATNADASAYRAVNTRFEALRTAAAALTAGDAWNATKTTSSSTNVTTTAGTTAVAGSSVTFAVTQLAGIHSEVSGGQWTSKTAPVASGTGPVPAWPITITNTATNKSTVVPIADDATLADAAAAINKANAGVTASVIQLGKDAFRLQLTSTTSGAAGTFTITGNGGADAGFLTTDQGQDAVLSIGTTGAGGGLTASSSTNTFTDLLPGVTITASKADPSTSVTVGVSADPSAVAANVQTLIDAANSLLSAVSSYTDADSKSAVLKGDSTLRGLSSQILSIVSGTLGGKSASTVGVALSRSGQLTFDKDVFTAKLASDPTTVQKLFAEKKIVSTGADQISGNADDVTSPVGLAAQLEVLAKGASDSTTGSLVLLAKSEDSLAKDLQARIDAWDTRLALRRQTITRQFTAMETALSTMQNQAGWLSSQIASLPSWSSSSK